MYLCVFKNKEYILEYSQIERSGLLKVLFENKNIVELDDIKNLTQEIWNFIYEFLIDNESFIRYENDHIILQSINMVNFFDIRDLEELIIKLILADKFSIEQLRKYDNIIPSGTPFKYASHLSIIKKFSKFDELTEEELESFDILRDYEKIKLIMNVKPYILIDRNKHHSYNRSSFKNELIKDIMTETPEDLKNTITKEYLEKYKDALKNELYKNYIADSDQYDYFGVFYHSDINNKRIPIILNKMNKKNIKLIFYFPYRHIYKFNNQYYLSVNDQYPSIKLNQKNKYSTCYINDSDIAFIVFSIKSIIEMDDHIILNFQTIDEDGDYIFSDNFILLD